MREPKVQTFVVAVNHNTVFLCIVAGDVIRNVFFAARYGELHLMNLWSVLQSFPLPVGIIIDKSEGFVVGAMDLFCKAAS